MAKDNIQKLAEIVQQSVKDEEVRDKFIDFIIGKEETGMERAYILEQVERMFTDLFTGGRPHSKMTQLMEALDDGSQEEFISVFPYDSREWATYLVEYKSVKKVCKVYAKLITYKACISNKRFIDYVELLPASNLPYAVTPLVKLVNDEDDNRFRIKAIGDGDNVERFFERCLFDETAVRRLSASDRVKGMIEQYTKAYVTKKWGAMGIMGNDSFAMIGIDTTAYAPDTELEESSLFTPFYTPKTGAPLNEKDILKYISQWYRDREGLPSSEGLKVTFTSLVDTLITPLTLSSVLVDSNNKLINYEGTVNKEVPIKLTLDKKGTTVYVSPFDMYNVLSTLSYATRGAKEDEEAVVDLYYDETINSLLVDCNFSYEQVVYFTDVRTQNSEEHISKIPFAGVIKCLDNENSFSNMIATVDLTNLSPTITLKEKLGVDEVIVDHLDIPAKILRENPILTQFLERQLELLKIANNEELYETLIAFSSKYVDTYAPFQEKVIYETEGREQKEKKATVRWLNEEKDKFKKLAKENKLEQYVLQVQEAFWQSNTSMDIQTVFAYFCTKGTNRYYRLLCVQILGFDYAHFVSRLSERLLEDEKVCVSRFEILEETGRPVYFGTVPYELQYIAEYKSGDVYEKLEQLNQMNGTLQAWFSSKKGQAISLNQTQQLKEAQPDKMKLRWEPKTKVLQSYTENKDIPESKKEQYRLQQLRTITFNANDEICYETELFFPSSRSYNSLKSMFIDWLQGDGALHISPHIIIENSEYSTADLINDAYLHPLQKGIFIYKHLRKIELNKRSRKTGKSSEKVKDVIELELNGDHHKATSSFGSSPTIISNNDPYMRKGLTVTTREELAKLGYLDKDEKIGSTEYINVSKEDAKRLWDILETLFYETTSEIKIEGEKLFNLWLRSTVSVKAEPKLNDEWNKRYNNFAKPDYANIPIFSKHSYYFKDNIKSPFKLREAQKEGLQYLTAYENGGLLGHEVGFGKTTTAITKCAELILTGKGTRILTIVPNIVYDNWIREIRGGADSDGNYLIGLLGKSVKLIPVGNLGLSDLRGRKRLSRTPEQKAQIKKGGTHKGAKTYFDSEDKGEFDEVGAIQKITDISKIILEHIGQYARRRGEKLETSKKTKRKSKLENGGLIRFSDRKIEGAIPIEPQGRSTKTINVDSGAQFYNKAQCVSEGDEFDTDDIVLNRLNFSGTASLPNFLDFVDEQLASAIPNYTDHPELVGIRGHLLEIAEAIRKEWITELTTLNSPTNIKFKHNYAYTPYEHIFNLKEYCQNSNEACNLDECGDEFNGYKSGYEDMRPDFRFWIDEQYTLLEQKLTDRYIWFFKKLRGIMVGRMGSWKRWAVTDTAIIIAKHSAVENIKVPEPSVNTAIIEASDVERLEDSTDFYKGFSLPLRHNSIPIEDLNVDTVIIDEAHNFNRIIDKTRRRTIREDGRDRPQRLFGKARNNQKAMDYIVEYSFKSNALPTLDKFNLYSLCKYIGAKSTRNQNVILLTATPFTDDNYQMLSLFSMIDQDRLRMLNVNSAYEFFVRYVQEAWKWDINQRNQFGLFAKIDGYVNGYALSSFIKSFGNFKISDKEIERRRPKKFTISSSTQNEADLKDCKSIIDLSKTQLRMVTNISKYTNGDLEDVNEFGFDTKMLEDAKMGKVKASVKGGSYIDEEYEKEIEARLIDLKANEMESSEWVQLRQELERFNTDNPYIVEWRKKNAEAGEEEDVDHVDGSEAVKSGAMGQEASSNAKAFRGQSLNLKLAISPYLISGNKENTLMNPLLPPLGANDSVNAKNFVDESPKIKYTITCALELLLHHQKENEGVEESEQTAPSGQVIYLNLYRFTYGGVNYTTFDLIKQYMEDVCADEKSKYFGLLTPAQIQYLISDTTDKDKETIKDGFLSGEVLILIGTETIKEGINLQENATVMYIVNSEFSPVKVMQLQGRIWRQGNNWENCFIINVLARRSLDAFVYSKLDLKITAVREMLDSDVYEMDATQFTMDANQIKVELTTDVEQLVKIGWIEKEKELSTILKVEKIKLEALKGIEENYENALESSKSLKETFNEMSEQLSLALTSKMIGKIQKAENNKNKDEAIEKAQKKSKKPLTEVQIQKIRKGIKPTTEAQAEAKIGDEEKYMIDFQHIDLEKAPFVALSTQLRKLLEEYLVVEQQYEFIKSLEDTKSQSTSSSKVTVAKKKEILEAKTLYNSIEKEITDPSIDITKLGFKNRLLRVMRGVSGEKYEGYRYWYSVDYEKFEKDVDLLVGGKGISKTLGDYAMYIEADKKKIGDVPKEIKKQEKKFNKAEADKNDVEGQKKILKAKYKKEMAGRDDPKKKVSLEKAVGRFKKIFPYIQLKK